MPPVAQSAIQWDIHSHTWEPIPPQASIDDIMAGRSPIQPNSCMSAVGCHDGTSRGPVWEDDNLQNLGIAQLIFEAFFPGATKK